MSIEWNPGWAVGIELIDAQHKEIVEQVDALIEALQQARGKQRVEATLGFLEAYAARHFALEERLM
ncbi:MAG: hemerythrin domain-containing protein, partial [Deltaproteobacteria bacterium]|nr:hemerythrin domain-containing protein [Deltaproteobacteria bacterium]